TNDERDLSARRRDKARSNLRGRPAHDLFEPLGQLTTDGHLTLGPGFCETRHRAGQPLRRLERNGRPGPTAELLPQGGRLGPATRQVAEKRVTLRDETAGDEGRLDG